MAWVNSHWSWVEAARFIGCAFIVGAALGAIKGLLEVRHG